MDNFTIQTVPILNIIGMIFTLIVSIATPIVLLIITLRRWRGKAKIASFFLGAATFFVSAMVLEQILHTLVLSLTGDLIKNNIWLYAIYGGLAAGLFEESGRFITMKYFMKNTLDKENAITYGIGHGGFEAILIVGLTSVSNLIVTILINMGQLESILAPMDQPTRSLTLESLSALWTTPGYQFFLSGMERISAIMLHIVLSYLVYLAVKKHELRWFPIAIGIHALIDAGTILLARVLPVLLLELVLLGMVILLGYWVYRFLWEQACETELH